MRFDLQQIYDLSGVPPFVIRRAQNSRAWPFEWPRDDLSLQQLISLKLWRNVSARVWLTPAESRLVLVLGESRAFDIFETPFDYFFAYFPGDDSPRPAFGYFDFAQIAGRDEFGGPSIGKIVSLYWAIVHLRKRFEEVRRFQNAVIEAHPDFTSRIGWGC